MDTVRISVGVSTKTDCDVVSFWSGNSGGR